MSLTPSTRLSAPVEMPETRSGGYREIAMSHTAGGGGSLLPQSFGEVVAFAEIMARSQHAIPAHLRGNAGACMAVTMLAMRLEMDPFALASKSYITKEGATIAYEAQMFAAIVHTRAPIKRTSDYVFEGEGDRLRCTVSAEMKDGSTKIYQSPELGRIPVKNSPLWKGDPQQQIGYYSIRAWARRHCPEVILGIYTPDEIETAPRIGPDRARDVSPPRGIAGKLDALAAGPATQRHDPETGEIDSSAAGGALADAADSDDAQLADSRSDEAATETREELEDPREALLGELRSVAMRGTKPLKKAISMLDQKRFDLLTAEDRKLLEQAAEKFGADA